jgi:hypothetical protein
MTTILDTITEYEEKALELLVQIQEPVLEYVKKAVDFIESRLPEQRFELPETLPAPTAVVATQFAFAKKVLANQEKFAKNVVKTVAPLTGETVKKAPAKATSAAA